jgi:uncharacterized membrane protein
MVAQAQPSRVIRIFARVGFVVVLLLTALALLSVCLRFAFTWRVLSGDTASLPSNVFEDRYAAHPWLTMAHILAGFLFMVTGPWQFVPAIRTRFLRFHRVSGRIYIVASLVAALTALAYVPLLPVFGTFTAKAGTTVGAVLFLISIFQAYATIRRREIRKHREWMIRSYALGLGIATFRLFLPILMSPPLRLPFPEAWDTVVWLGFTINIAVAETWINVTRNSQSTPGTSGAISGATKQDRRLHRPAGAAAEM